MLKVFSCKLHYNESTNAVFFIRINLRYIADGSEQT